MTEYFPDEAYEKEDFLQATKPDPQPPPKRERIARMPLFQTLLRQAVETLDVGQDRDVLLDFADYVAGPISDELGSVAAKGGNFFRAREAEERENTARYRLDQTMRAHLVNGLLPVLHIARHLAAWGAKTLRHWGPEAQRLFVAGFVLHDFMKLPDVKDTLKAQGFTELEVPHKDLMPVLEVIFRDWCARLGLDRFLEPIGGSEIYLHDLIYIACNTQRLWGTAHNRSLFEDEHSHATSAVRQLATRLSNLADLLAYVAPNPRALVSHRRINEIMRELAVDRDKTLIARLTYHHVAENRGLLLNFIHDGAQRALAVPGCREPLLYAPSGIVYLERLDAPAVPEHDALVTQIVTDIRTACRRKLEETLKGAKRGNVGIKTDAIYADFFDLRQYIEMSPRLVERYIGNNKAPDRLSKFETNDLPGADDIPAVPEAPKDARVDQFAEWATLVEREMTARLDKNDGPEWVDRFTTWLLTRLDMYDLYGTIITQRADKRTKKAGGGMYLWWFWFAAHLLNRHPVLDPVAWMELIEQLAHEWAAQLPDPLPEKAQEDPVLWNDITDYIAQVLTVGHQPTSRAIESELTQYVNAKKQRGQKVCALCGSKYTVRAQEEASVAFQPGVYTSRLPLGASDNNRHSCSICMLEQLMRQLFITNLDKGSAVEKQRVRYLALYPTYFFTPETLAMAQHAYHDLSQFRIRDLKSTLEQHDLTNPRFWQRLEIVQVKPDGDDEADVRRILRYDQNVPATFLMLGFRNFNDPTDSESWIIPAFLSLLLPLCLDVKVVASESGIPLVIEADELPETVWLDGAHPAIRTVIDAARHAVARTSEDSFTLHGDSGRINVDEVGTALAWLTATYLIHLDTEMDRSENWNRLPRVAHSLVDSPLYVFHHLKRQERNSDSKTPAGADKIARYVRFAEMFALAGGQDHMNHARKLVELYRGFYRAKTIRKSNSVLRPLAVVSDAVLNADPQLFPDAEAQIDLALGELTRFMDRVGAGQADGRFPKDVSREEREIAMREFCEYFVKDVFWGVFDGDVAALRGKQLNLLRSACEGIYRHEQNAEWAARRDAADREDIDDDELDTDE